VSNFKTLNIFVQHTQTALEVLTWHCTMLSHYLILWVYSYWWICILWWWYTWSLLIDSAETRSENVMLEVVLEVGTDFRWIILLMVCVWDRWWVHQFLFLDRKNDLCLNSLGHQRLRWGLAYWLILRMLNKARDLRWLGYCKFRFPNSAWARSLFQDFIDFFFSFSCWFHSL